MRWQLKINDVNENTNFGGYWIFRFILFYKSDMEALGGAMMIRRFSQPRSTWRLNEEEEKEKKDSEEDDGGCIQRGIQIWAEI